jgi:hypothetical protein
VTSAIFAARSTGARALASARACARVTGPVATLCDFGGDFGRTLCAFGADFGADLGEDFGGRVAFLERDALAGDRFLARLECLAIYGCTDVRTRSPDYNVGQARFEHRTLLDRDNRRFDLVRFHARTQDEPLT